MILFAMDLELGRAPNLGACDIEAKPRCRLGDDGEVSA
jgi:hypothetical protein